MQNRNFGPIADRYDGSRSIPSALLAEAFARLRQESALSEVGSSVLDVGCGTGQLALPLAAEGYDVVGVDISEEMVAIARTKASPDWSVGFETGCAESLRFEDNSFDTVVASKLFQHVPEWREAIAQIVRVLRPGGSFIYLNESGAFRHSVRKKMEELANESGYQDRYAGTIDSSAIAGQFEELGCARQEFDMSDLSWDFDVTFEDALEAFRNRMFAEFWTLPADVYTNALEKLSEWVSAQGGATSETMKPFLKVVAFRAPQ